MTIAQKINDLFNGMTQKDVRKYCLDKCDIQLYAEYLDVIHFDKLQGRFKEEQHKRLFVDGLEDKKEVKEVKEDINIPKHQDNTIRPIVDIEKVPNELKDTIQVIIKKEDYRQAKLLMISYVKYMYDKHKTTITPKEIEVLYKESDFLSQRELKDAITTVIGRGYKEIKFFAFKDVSRTKFNNFNERRFSRMEIYQMTKNFMS